MTEESSAARKCPRCGTAVPADAAHGLCPRCVFARAIAATGGAPIEPPDIEAVRAAFPQFEVVSFIGTGGMGAVFKVRQPQLDRFVALKILAPQRTDDPRFAERFQREAQALARLNHPSIVTIHDFGQAGGFYFLLMEFVDGVNLRQAMKAGRFTPEQALAIVPPVCVALQYAHEHGIVHRDIKPENLLLDKEGRVKIADFGIAKILGAESSGVGFSESQPAGTPQYMAPEQKEHRVTDHRADIYSLGVVLYEMLTGELPADKLQPPSKRVQVDVRIDEIVLRALEVKPELRFATAADFRTQVEMLATPAAPLSRSRESRFIKVGTSTLATPEQLATFQGQFFAYHTRGQLILDDRQLTHSRDGTNTVIPLAAIRDLSVGKFPRTVNPAGLDLISVTYEEGGQRKRLLLSPMKGWFGFPHTYNANVAEWFTAIREAATAASGTAPSRTSSDQLGLPGSNLSVLLVCGVLVAVGLFLIWLRFFQPEGSQLKTVTEPGEVIVQNHPILGLIALVAGGCLGFLIIRGVWRAVSNPAANHSASPATSRPGCLPVIAITGTVAVVLFAIMLVVWSVSSRWTPIVTPYYTPIRLEKNVVILDLQAVIVRGPVEVQVTLEGPELPANAMTQVLSSKDLSEDPEVVTPGYGENGRRVRTLKTSTTTWRAAFVLPNESLAKAVWEDLRPLGPLEIRTDRSTVGTLFEVTTPQGETYTGRFIVRPIRSRLGAEASAAEALARKVATPPVNSKIPAIVSGRLLDQDGKPLGRKPLAFVKEGSVVITGGPTGNDGTFQFELPVDQPWQVLLLGARAYGKRGPRSEAMITPTPGSSTSDVPDYDLELRLDGSRLQARLTPLSLEAMKGSETNTPQSIVASRLQLAALLKELADLRETFGARHPKVLELLKRIEDLRTILGQQEPSTPPAPSRGSTPMPKDGANAKPEIIQAPRLPEYPSHHLHKETPFLLA